MIILALENYFNLAGFLECGVCSRYLHSAVGYGWLVLNMGVTQSVL